jgi:hypothetical protein
MINLQSFSYHLYPIIFLLGLQCYQNPLQMKSEEIILKEMDSGDFFVRINYTFFGYLLFPLSVSFPEPENFEFKKFKRYWNQTPVPVEKRIAPIHKEYSLFGSSYHALYESILPISLSESSILIDQYEFSPVILESSNKSEIPTGKYIEYILLTGSGWKGRIEEIKIHLYLKERICKKILILLKSYYGFFASEYYWQSTQKNCKPTKNIRLAIPLKK